MNAGARTGPPRHIAPQRKRKSAAITIDLLGNGPGHVHDAHVQAEPVEILLALPDAGGQPPPTRLSSQRVLAAAPTSSSRTSRLDVSLDGIDGVDDVEKAFAVGPQRGTASASTPGPDSLLETRDLGHVDGAAQEVFQRTDEAGSGEQARIRRQIDQEVEVAVLVATALGHRAEHPHITGSILGTDSRDSSARADDWRPTAGKRGGEHRPAMPTPPA